MHWALPNVWRQPRPLERVGCTPTDLALTTSTTEGIARVLLALELRAGDEIVTSDEEHPGVLGPLAAQRAREPGDPT